ncbi:hypothetical protein [Streptomyces antarcticus]|uniref:hypothetical protein n=1 Tax=Streptomyces antarcticus TaxID=2996458 RepID=UPI002272116F|nr:MULTISPECIES: hypothetical protein [unclassified Streptomyces]MCY0942953.1 hypothetical protein [Streptomyces sp. H34-AA3]MCZ4083087.1 hypothetical protein [Streptomyces sp. H34-S5]
MTTVLDPPVAYGRAAGDAPAAPATGVRRLAADPDAVDAVCAALSALYVADGPVSPVILAATDYCVHAADQFAARCADPDRRLRPADSVALEPSVLLREFTVGTGWQGPAYALGDPAGDGISALRFADGLVVSGRAAGAYVCEVLRRGDTGVFWAVATRLRPAGTGLPRTGLPRTPEVRPAGLDEATWERSAIVREYRRRAGTDRPVRAGRTPASSTIDQHAEEQQ